MRRPAATMFAFLILYWTALPLLACIVPHSGMTAEEHECCEHMAQMCDSAKMPQSHSCCKPEVRSGSMLVATTNHQIDLPMLAEVALPLPVPPQASAWICGSTPPHPPDESLPDTTVLRI